MFIIISVLLTRYILENFENRLEGNTLSTFCSLPGATVALIVGVAIGALLVVGAIVAIFIRFSRRRKRPNFEDIDLEDLNGYTSRSAPISR